MANLEELANIVRNDGYSEINAEAKVCQDIVLKAIAQSSLNRNITRSVWIHTYLKIRV